MTRTRTSPLASLLLVVTCAGTARAADPRAATEAGRSAIVLEAEGERIGGCWIAAERKLLYVLRQTRPGTEDDSRSHALSELALLHVDRGDAELGEELAREAVESARAETARARSLRALFSALYRNGRRGTEPGEVVEALIRLQNGRPDDVVGRALLMRIQATLALRRGKNTEALSILRIADGLLAQEVPFSVERALILNHLGPALEVAQDPSAVDVGEHACSILERLTPEGFHLTQGLNNLAIARGSSGDLDGALKDFRRALAIRERLAPGGVESARALQNMSSVYRYAGDLVEAESAARTALSMMRGHDRIVPLHRLRHVLFESGQHGAETEVLCERADLIESHGSLAGSTEQARQALRSWDGSLYGELGAHFVRLGLPENALTVIEGSRSRSFFASRRLARHRALEGSSIRPERSRLRGLYEATQSRLGGLDARTHRQAADEASAELFRLGLLLERIEAVEPREFHPRERSATTIRDELDPGTLALVYLAETYGSVVLAVQRGEPIFGASLPPGGELDRRVRRYERLVARASERGPSRALVEEGRELACLLLGPVAHLLTGAARLVISPDSMFARVPFPALIVDDASGEPVFLAERLPISHAASLTALLENRLERFVPPDGPLWCIGDPAGSLPGARAEALGVSALHPGPTRVLLGHAAQEALIKSLPDSAGSLHFACHASSNAREPEDSTLFLAPPSAGATDNGQLRAWEIANEMSLGADLVVLSACTSSSAVDTNAEGSLGLARAFQIAGARRVLAARWRVPDEPTALFMEAFYSARARGLAADRCLQEAQVALRSNPETAHPYYWAGFVLHGDGR